MLALTSTPASRRPRCEAIIWLVGADALHQTFVQRHEVCFHHPGQRQHMLPPEAAQANHADLYGCKALLSSWPSSELGESAVRDDHPMIRGVRNGLACRGQGGSMATRDRCSVEVFGALVWRTCVGPEKVAMEPERAKQGRRSCARRVTFSAVHWPECTTLGVSCPPSSDRLQRHGQVHAAGLRRAAVSAFFASAVGGVVNHRAYR